MARVVVVFLLVGFHLSLFAGGDLPDNRIAGKMTRENALNVYIDCSFCDMSYLKENFPIINYVRDRKVADVHVLMTTIRTGSGGREITMEFIGQDKFYDLKDEIIFNLQPNYSKEALREGILHHLQLGLVPYILRTPFGDKLSLNVDEEIEIVDEGDPWNYWVFSARSSGQTNLNANAKNYYYSGGFSIHRITDQVKYKTDGGFGYSERISYVKDDNLEITDTVAIINRSYSLNNLYVKSIGNHWGVGAYLNFNSNYYKNIEYKYAIKPAIEYNFFDFGEASRRQFRVGYAAGYLHNDYFDSTSYNQTKENLFEQVVDIDFRYVAEWGTLYASVWRSNYFHDFNLSNTGIHLGYDLKLLKGLALYSHFSLNFPRNQIEIRKQDLSVEDQLLRKFEMETNYSFYGKLGFSYTFGSIYNNFVNPRFD